MYSDIRSTMLKTTKNSHVRMENDKDEKRGGEENANARTPREKVDEENENSKCRIFLHRVVLAYISGGAGTVLF